MVEKRYYCKKCKTVYEKIDEIICPKCNIPLKEMDFIQHEDMSTFLKELGYGDNVTKFYSENN